MNKDSNKKPNKKGLYIAVCCFALIAAAVGYAGNKSRISQTQTEKNSIENEFAVKETEAPVITESEAASEEVEIEIKADDFTPTEKKSEQSSPIKEQSTVEASANAEIIEPEFILPVKGKILTKYSGNDMLYNDLLSEWRTHNGIDIKCDNASAIYASADGTVAQISENAMGITVKITHDGGYTSVYSNLSDTLEISEGDAIGQGELIGKVGSTAVADFTNEPHLHFEILHDGKYENPQKLIQE